MQFIEGLKPVLLISYIAGLTRYFPYGKEIQRNILYFSNKLCLFAFILLVLYAQRVCVLPENGVGQVVTTFSSVLLLVSLIRIFLFEIIDEKKIHKLLTVFMDIDNRIKVIYNELNYNSTKRRCKLTLGLCAIICFAHLFESMTVLFDRHLPILCYEIYHNAHAQSSMGDYLIFVLCLELKHRFNVLNSFIEEIIKLNHQKYAARNKLNLNSVNLSDLLIECSDIHMELCALSKLVNNTFKLQILLRTSCCLFKISGVYFLLCDLGNYYLVHPMGLFRLWLTGIVNFLGIGLLFLGFILISNEV